MRVETPMRRVVYWAALAAMAVSLAGCDSVREAAGLTKDSPDEFAVVTKAPLIIPPDYNLTPPKPGAAPTNQVSPTEDAEDTLYGQQQTATTAQGSVSSGEQQLLSKAGAANANSMIRQKIAADNRAMQASDESFTNQLLFGAGSDHSQGTQLDADAEKKRLDEGGTGGATSAAPAPSTDDTTPTQKDSGGWFDDILDGVF